MGIQELKPKQNWIFTKKWVGRSGMPFAIWHDLRIMALSDNPILNACSIKSSNGFVF